MGEAMTREAVERELREKLEARRTPWEGAKEGSVPLLRPEVESLLTVLVPWIMEIVEHARAEERIECGELPRNEQVDGKLDSRMTAG